MKEDFNLSNKIEKEGSGTWGFENGFLDADDVKEFIHRFKKYIQGQNFNGTPFRLKSNIINRLRELSGERLNSGSKSFQHQRERK